VWGGAFEGQLGEYSLFFYYKYNFPKIPKKERWERLGAEGGFWDLRIAKWMYGFKIV
jgi:hypothetical protein